MVTSHYQQLKSENNISNRWKCVWCQTLTVLYISFLFRLSMADLSTAKKGEITIDKNVSYYLFQQSCTGHMGEGKRGGGGGNNQEYEVISVPESHLPPQVSGESSLGKGGSGNITPPHPPPTATSTGGGGGEERVYEEIPGGQ